MSKITRRTLLKSATLGAALWTQRSFAKSSSRKPQVVISGWGGTTQRAMRQAYFIPFTLETGIEVVEQTYASHGLARLKAQLREGAAQVDLLDGPPFWPIIGHEQNLLDRISLPGVNKAHFIAGALDDYAFGYSTASWGITYIKGRRSSPTNWAEFWNTREHPGRRAFFGLSVARHPEYALMAEGVEMSQINPLDGPKIERAFAKLAEIKPAINVWYQTPAQCERLLLEQQIEMAEFFNGRAYFLKDQGVPVEFVWNEAITNVPVFVLARDAPNRDNALQFLSYIARPEPQASFAELISYGPTNKRALDLIKSQATLERLPTYEPNFARQLLLDGKWWGEHQDRLAPRWSQLIAG
jgi:putative spermidine/putrescine transport system substrate-binding protein